LSGTDASLSLLSLNVTCFIWSIKEGLHFVRLFHGGTKEAKEAFCLNETVPVYRQSYERYSRELKEVGKVKITQYSGEHYFDAEVVEGEVREGDIVKKPSAACLVQLPVPEDK
jgi:hypothetical protein